LVDTLVATSMLYGAREIPYFFALSMLAESVRLISKSPPQVIFHIMDGRITRYYVVKEPIKEIITRYGQQAVSWLRMCIR
jgi:hypothetical protein